MQRILFVDDEPKLLDGLRRMLRGMRHEWDMRFVESGSAALAALDETPCEVVVTDMRMPGMDGSELLGHVLRRFPGAARIILSGQCDQTTVLRSIGPTHQFLTKPCDSETIRATVARTCRMRDRLTDDWQKRLASQVRSLCSLPENYAALRAEIEAEQPSMRAVTQIIARDVGMSLRALQLVSSGFFGSPQPVVRPEDAVGLLGLDIVRPLTLTAGAFEPFARSVPAGFSWPALSEHSLAVAMAAEAIAADEAEAAAASGANEAACAASRTGGDPSAGGTIADCAFAAGLLHDVGVFVLAQEAPDELGDFLRGRDHADSPGAAHVDDLTHVKLGAYLVALWGLPDCVVDAIAFHHDPVNSPSMSFDALTAVHVADAILGRAEPGATTFRHAFDRDYLRRIGCEGKLARWQTICEEATAAAAIN